MQMLFLKVCRFKIADAGYHLNLLGLNVPFPWDIAVFVWMQGGTKGHKCSSSNNLYEHKGS